MQTRTKLTAVAVAMIAAAAATITVAGAQTGSLEIPIDTVVQDVGEGSTTVLATVDVPADLQGATCTVTSEAENNSSVHLGNDLVVRSGNDTETMSDVEGAPGKVTPASEQLTLGPTITVSLVMGPDDVFSGGGVVTLDCTAPEPTTTTTTTTTTTSAPTTTTAAVAVSPSSIAPTPTTAAPTVAPTTSTVATQVLPGVQVAAPAQATPGSPSFTG